MTLPPDKSKRWQFGLKSLLCAIVYTSLVAAALGTGSAMCLTGLFSASLFTLVWAVLAACLGPPRSRRYWIGFSVFGWVYITILYLPRQVGMDEHLITETVARYLASALRDSRTDWGDYSISLFMRLAVRSAAILPVSLLGGMLVATLLPAEERQPG